MLSLTSFMDETGHADDPTLHFAGMAGFVAPLGNWEVFEERWNSALKNAGLTEPFHMKEFAHSVGQFESWKGKEELRQLFFGHLIKIIQDTQADPVGVAISVNDFNSLTPSQQSSFGGDPYYIAFQKCTRGAASSALFEAKEEQVAMVFAFQGEFGNRAEQLWYAMQKSPKVEDIIKERMGSYASCTPKKMCQLQAADLFAYELLKEFENQIMRPTDKMRYGMRQILKMEQAPEAPRIVLMDRIELLRTIKEAGFKDQTGTEKLGNHNIISAMQRMTDWRRQRGEE